MWPRHKHQEPHSRILYMRWWRKPFYKVIYPCLHRLLTPLVMYSVYTLWGYTIEVLYYFKHESAENGIAKWIYTVSFKKRMCKQVFSEFSLFVPLKFFADDKTGLKMYEYIETFTDVILQKKIKKKKNDIRIHMCRVSTFCIQRFEVWMLLVIAQPNLRSRVIRHSPFYTLLKGIRMHLIFFSTWCWKSAYKDILWYVVSTPRWT